MLLLDTNMLSTEMLAKYDSWQDEELVTASTCAQEVLGMPRSRKESGYVYALPVMDERIHGLRDGMPSAILNCWIKDHAKRTPVSRQTDILNVAKSRLRVESRELGHAAVALAHKQGHDHLFQAFSSRGLRGRKLKRVRDKWKFLRTHIDLVIPLDDEIIAQALVFADLFVLQSYSVKKTTRNTMNDLFLAATAQVEDIPMKTKDEQLADFLLKNGWSVTKEGVVFLAIPPSRATDISADVSTNQSTQSGSTRYVNRPRYLRSNFDQAPPPTF